LVLNWFYCYNFQQGICGFPELTLLQVFDERFRNASTYYLEEKKNVKN
jgi:hypothetical protein